MVFQLVLITPEVSSARELEAARSIFSHSEVLQRIRLHVRKPHSSEDDVRAYLDALPPAARKRCMLHQHHELAKRATVEGIHYREADRPSIIRAPPGLAVSTSFHTLEDLTVCRGELDYAFLSPIYQSISKQGYQAAFPDRQQLADSLATSRHPILALGGVTADRFSELRDLGFAGAAMLGAVWSAPDPVLAVEQAMQAANELE